MGIINVVCFDPHGHGDALEQTTDAFAFPLAARFLAGKAAGRGTLLHSRRPPNPKHLLGTPPPFTDIRMGG